MNKNNKDAVDKIFDNPHEMGTVNQEPVDANMKNRLWSAIEAQIDQEAKAPPQKTEKKLLLFRPQAYLPIAALLAIAISTFIVLENSPQGLDEKLLASESIRWQGTKSQLINLPKTGLKFTLHRAQNLTLEQQGSHTILILNEGLALFDFDHEQQNKSLEIKTKQASVIVTGTKFSVQSQPFQVVLFEGKVKVTRNQKEFNLAPHQAFTIGGGVSSISIGEASQMLAALKAEKALKTLALAKNGERPSQNPRPAPTKVNIHLKDGTVVSGTIIKEEKDHILMKTSFGNLKVKRGQIDRIKKQ